MEDQTETYHGEPDAVILLDPAAGEKSGDGGTEPSSTGGTGNGGPLTLPNTRSDTTSASATTGNEGGVVTETSRTDDATAAAASKKRKRRIRYRRNKRAQSAQMHQGQGQSQSQGQGQSRTRDSRSVAEAEPEEGASPPVDMEEEEAELEQLEQEEEAEQEVVEVIGGVGVTGSCDFDSFLVASSIRMDQPEGGVGKGTGNDLLEPVVIIVQPTPVMIQQKKEEEEIVEKEAEEPHPSNSIPSIFESFAWNGGTPPSEEIEEITTPLKREAQEEDTNGQELNLGEVSTPLPMSEDVVDAKEAKSEPEMEAVEELLVAEEGALSSEPEVMSMSMSPLQELEIQNRNFLQSLQELFLSVRSTDTEELVESLAQVDNTMQQIQGQAQELASLFAKSDVLSPKFEFCPPKKAVELEPEVEEVLPEQEPEPEVEKIEPEFDAFTPPPKKSLLLFPELEGQSQGQTQGIMEEQVPEELKFADSEVSVDTLTEVTGSGSFDSMMFNFNPNDHVRIHLARPEMRDVNVDVAGSRRIPGEESSIPPSVTLTMEEESDSEQNQGCCVKLRKVNKGRSKVKKGPPTAQVSNTASFKQRSASMKQRISSVFSKGGSAAAAPSDK